MYLISSLQKWNWCIQKKKIFIGTIKFFIFFQNLSNNIKLFSIAPCEVIALDLLCLIIGISSLLLNYIDSNKLLETIAINLHLLFTIASTSRGSMYKIDHKINHILASDFFVNSINMYLKQARNLSCVQGIFCL